MGKNCGKKGKNWAKNCAKNYAVLGGKLQKFGKKLCKKFLKKFKFQKISQFFWKIKKKKKSDFLKRNIFLPKKVKTRAIT